jgi:hypothetical protein
MPMSAKAYAGIKAAVEWNPYAAQFLLHILQETPQWVKYKDDLYGPLSLILASDVIRKRIFDKRRAQITLPSSPTHNDVSVPVKLPPIPQEKLDDCKAFGDEWKQHSISKKELADAIEQILSELS